MCLKIIHNEVDVSKGQLKLILDNKWTSEYWIPEIQIHLYSGLRYSYG